MNVFVLCKGKRDGCIADALGRRRYVVERQCADDVFQRIRAEADDYRIRVVSESVVRDRESSDEYMKTIPDDQIVVATDGLHFTGVVDESDYNDELEPSNNANGLGIALIEDITGKKSKPLICKNGVVSYWYHDIIMLNRKKRKDA